MVTPRIRGAGVDAIMMHHFTSSVLKAFGYDEAQATLRVKWKQGHVGEYLDVPLQVYEDLKEANSYGSYIHHAVKPNYKYRVVEFGDAWDGEERRTVNEPLDFEEDAIRTTHQLTLKDASGNQIRLECLDMTAEDEKLFAARLINCVNACAGLPSDRILEIVNAGLVALGVMDRRASRRDETLPVIRELIAEDRKPSLRELPNVITQIISLIPVEQGLIVEGVETKTLCSALNSIRKSAEFAAPESQLALWKQTAFALNLYLNFETIWQKQILEVFNGQRTAPDFEQEAKDNGGTK